jgi:hypothetical protein
MAEYTADGLKNTILRRIEESMGQHQYFVNLYERRSRSYRGVKERALKDKWQHNLRPPYAFNLLETVVASQIDMGLTFEVRPSPHAHMSAQEAQHMLAMADDVEDLLRHEHRVDRFDRKQRPLFLSDGIGGIGVGKTYWNYVPGLIKRQGVEHKQIFGPNGEVLYTEPTIVEIEEEGILRDHSTTEVVDPRDFIWHESARDIDPRAPGGAQYITHRCWYSYEQLLELKRMGFISGDVEKLKESRDFSGQYTDRDTELFNVNRSKDLIEVMEHWWFEDGKIWYAWLANRDVLLVDKTENPFWHGQYPFFIVNSMPQPFSLRGTSTIELIEDLQSILWELQNQRLDNVELINNAIMLIRSDVDDPDAWEHYPGARWEVDSIDQVKSLEPPYQVAEVSISAENLIKGDLQTVTSAVPFAGGADSGTQTTSTATGASIVMNAAQQQLQMRKYQAQMGLQDEANMRLKNCQQFYDGHKMVHVIGKDGAMAFKDIPIDAIQGEYMLELEAMGESQLRQERRAEASQFAQLMMGFAPLAAAAGKPLDVEAIIRWFAKQWRIEYPDQFFSASAASMGAMAGLQGSGAPPGGPGAAAPPPGGAPPGGPNLGTTAATAVDASKPSATGGLSMSPAMFLQRAQALAGGTAGGGANQ